MTGSSGSVQSHLNCDKEWEILTREEHERSQLINETIRDIKNKLRRSSRDSVPAVGRKDAVDMYLTWF
jgi:hypothetical protein